MALPPYNDSPLTNSIFKKGSNHPAQANSTAKAQNKQPANNNSDGGAWYLCNNKTNPLNKVGEYAWFDDGGYHLYYTKVGFYKIIFNAELNQIEGYFKNEQKPQKTIDMATKVLNGKFNGYVTDNGAKFAMVSAELGGKGISTLFDALVISASMENRLFALNSGTYSKDDITKSGLVPKYKEKVAYTIQELFFSPIQYQASPYPAYQNFKKGHPIRFIGKPYEANLSLCLVFNALELPIEKLNELPYKFTDAISIIAYAHVGGGEPSLFLQYKIPFKKEFAPNLRYIEGSRFWKANGK